MSLKIISLDVWGTLIRSNPLNRVKRTERVAPLLGWSGDLVQLTAALGEASKVLDHQTELDGVQYGTRERVNYACQTLGLAPPSDDCFVEVERQIHEAQLENPTPLTEPDLPLTLRKWREEYGLQLAIVCNTGTAGGKTLADVLDHQGIMTHIDYPVWSDDVGAAKPNRAIFDHLVQKSGVVANTILHVGDNRCTDVAGASSAGLNSLYYDRRGTMATSDSYLRHSDLHRHEQFTTLL